MAEIHFTSHLRTLVTDGPLSAEGATVGEALAKVLAAQPHVRGYVLDDRGALRKHVCIFPMASAWRMRARWATHRSRHQDLRHAGAVGRLIFKVGEER